MVEPGGKPSSEEKGNQQQQNERTKAKPSYGSFRRSGEEVQPRLDTEIALKEATLPFLMICAHRNQTVWNAVWSREDKRATARARAEGQREVFITQNALIHGDPHPLGKRKVGLQGIRHLVQGVAGVPVAAQDARENFQSENARANVRTCNTIANTKKTQKSTQRKRENQEKRKKEAEEETGHMTRG